MNRYPSHIYAALAAMGPPDEEVDVYLQAFTARSGSFETPSLLRVFANGGEFDRLFALWALGATRSAKAREVLQPLLVSEHPLERWASALALAEYYHDEHALPVLQQMLSEMLPPCHDTHRIPILQMAYHASDYYFLWRHEIPDLLGDWGEAMSVPALRTGLQAILRVELALEDLKQHHDEEADGVIGSVSDWTDLEDSVVYALGRLRGFGALAGIVGAETPLIRSAGLSNLGAPQSHLEQWRIHLIMGSLHELRDQYSLSMLWQWEQTPALLQAVTQRMEQVFGLDCAEYGAALERYAVEMNFRLAEHYGWRRKDDAPQSSPS